MHTLKLSYVLTTGVAPPTSLH